MLNKSGLLAMAALAASGMGAMGGAEVMPRDFGGYRASPSKYNTRRTPKGGNPAGTKLARKAAKGRIGLRHNAEVSGPSTRRPGYRADFDGDK